MEIIIKSIDLPPEQRSCMRCTHFNEHGNCNLGKKVDESDMTTLDNGCKKFDSLVKQEW